MLVKYRVKASQFFAFGVSSNAEDSVYRVQVKYKWLPIWITITRRFNKLSQAEEHIQLKLKEWSK